MSVPFQRRLARDIKKIREHKNMSDQLKFIVSELGKDPHNKVCNFQYSIIILLELGNDPHNKVG